MPPPITPPIAPAMAPSLVPSLLPSIIERHADDSIHSNHSITTSDHIDPAIDLEAGHAQTPIARSLRLLMNADVDLNIGHAPSLEAMMTAFLQLYFPENPGKITEIYALLNNDANQAVIQRVMHKAEHTVPPLTPKSIAHAAVALIRQDETASPVIRQKDLEDYALFLEHQKTESIKVIETIFSNWKDLFDTAKKELPARSGANDVVNQVFENLKAEKPELNRLSATEAKTLKSELRKLYALVEQVNSPALIGAVAGAVGYLLSFGPAVLLSGLSAAAIATHSGIDANTAYAVALGIAPLVGAWLHTAAGQFAGHVAANGVSNATLYALPPNSALKNHTHVSETFRSAASRFFLQHPRNAVATNLAWVPFLVAYYGSDFLFAALPSLPSLAKPALRLGAGVVGAAITGGVLHANLNAQFTHQTAQQNNVAVKSTHQSLRSVARGALAQLNPFATDTLPKIMSMVPVAAWLAVRYASTQLPNASLAPEDNQAAQLDLAITSMIGTTMLIEAAWGTGLRDLATLAYSAWRNPPAHTQAADQRRGWLTRAQTELDVRV